MGGVKQEQLSGPLDFVYNDKAIINQNQLQHFLLIGKYLKNEGPNKYRKSNHKVK